MFALNLSLEKGEVQMKKILSIFLALSLASILALTFLYCGGGGGGDGTSGGENGGTVSTVYDIDEVVTKITTTMGENAGLGAVILAIDKGYSLGQIAGAAMTGRLETDGIINDGKGGIEEPEDLPVNLIESSGSLGMYVQAVKKYNLEEIKKKYNDYFIKHGGKRLFHPIMLLLILLDEGYSGEQVFTAIFTGNIEMLEIKFISIGYPYEEDFVLEPRIIDDQGNRVVPEDPPRRFFTKLKIQLSGPTSLELEDGYASGIWEITVTRGICRNTPEILYFWDDGTQIVVTSSPRTHQYKKAGTYQIRAHVSCLIEGSDRLEHSWSNTLVVKVSDWEAECLEGTWDNKYDYECRGEHISEDVIVFFSDRTYDKISWTSLPFIGTWVLSDEGYLILYTDATPKDSVWYEGTVNDDCTAITGKVHEVMPWEEYIYCWTATKIP
jgi:hypothetical protein